MNREWVPADLLATELAHVVARLRTEDRGYSSPCWITTYVPTPSGYVNLQIKRKVKGLHRRAYEVLCGLIPAGYQIDHLCRVRVCMNPAHLEPVTPRVNTLRSLALSAVNARKTHCKRGHEFTPENTRIDHQRGRRPARACRECARIRDRLAKARRRRRAAA